MFGYACDETPEKMPLPIQLAQRITARLAAARKAETVPYLRPDGKAQVTVRYSEQDGRLVPVAVERVLVSTQHHPDVHDEQQIRADVIEHVLLPVIPAHLCPHERLSEPGFVLVNPTGRFVTGGPMGDTGLTGRKIIVDTYGGAARHGGGAFSGKDPSKVDRSGAYAMRWVAKNIVSAGLAARAEVQVAYAIGVAHPVSVMVETYGTEQVDRASIERAVGEVFDLRPASIIRDLDLLRPDLPGHRDLRALRPRAAGLHLGAGRPRRGPARGLRARRARRRSDRPHPAAGHGPGGRPAVRLRGAGAPCRRRGARLAGAGAARSPRGGRCRGVGRRRAGRGRRRAEAGARGDRPAAGAPARPGRLDRRGHRLDAGPRGRAGGAAAAAEAAAEAGRQNRCPRTGR